MFDHLRTIFDHDDSPFVSNTPLAEQEIQSSTKNRHNDSDDVNVGSAEFLLHYSLGDFAKVRNERKQNRENCTNAHCF
jgi:hypothetical protein